MPLKERLKDYINSKNLTIRDFEKSIGVSNGYVNSISRSVGIEKVNQILENYPNMNLEWLFTGKGQMKIQHTSLNQSSQGIPLIPLDAMAGFGNGSKQIMDYETDRYVVPEFEDLNVDFMLRVKGSSMIPKYNSGDLVACKVLPLNDVFFQWHKVYVMDTIQGPMIKRVHPSKTDEHILCVSDNEDYKPFNLPLTEINNLAIVVGVIRLE